MRGFKPSLAAFVVMLAFSGQSFGQATSGKVATGTKPSGFASYPGAGTTQDYYSLSTGFGNYGLPGSSPSYAGHALSGYGPGAPVGGYFTATTPVKASKVTNNMDGLMKSIKQQTGKSPVYSNGKTPVGKTSAARRLRRSP